MDVLDLFQPLVCCVTNNLGLIICLQPFCSFQSKLSYQLRHLEHQTQSIASYQWVGGWREGDAAGPGEFQVEKSMRRIRSHKRPDQSFKHWEVPYCRMLYLFIFYYKTGPGPLWSEFTQPIIRNWTFKWTMTPSVRLWCHNNYTVTMLGHALQKLWVVTAQDCESWPISEEWV